MKNFILFFLLFSLTILLNACGQTNGSGSLSALSIQSLSVTPEAVASGGTVKIDLSLLNTDGSAIAYRIGDEETAFCSKESNQRTYKTSQTSGVEEINVYLSNGRVDTLSKVNVNINPALPATTLRYGTATLPINKSFDFFSGTVVDENYGDMHYSYESYYGNYLDFYSDRNGSSNSSYYVEKGIVNLTDNNPNCRNLNQVIEPFQGTYYPYVYETNNSSNPLKAENVYCFKLQYTASNTFYGKIKVLSVSDSSIVFDWVFQSAPNNNRFYDGGSSQSFSTPLVAPGGLTISSSSSSSATLSWTAVNDTSVIGYRIFRSTTSGSNYAQIASIGLLTTYTNSSLSSNTTYYYKVKTVYSYSQLSNFSSEISVTTQSAPAVPAPEPPPPPPTTSETSFNDDGESGIGNWTASGFTLSTAKSYSPTHSYYSGRGYNITNYLTKKIPVNITGTKSLKFITNYNTEAYYDYLYVQVSTDGNAWSNLGSFCGTTSNAWVEKSYSLSSYSGTLIYIRFKYYSDPIYDYEGVYIDDIRIE